MSADVVAQLVEAAPIIHRITRAVVPKPEDAEEALGEGLMMLGDALLTPAGEALDAAGRRLLAMELGARAALGFPSGRPRALDRPALQAGRCAVAAAGDVSAEADASAAAGALSGIDAMYRLVLLLREHEGLDVTTIARLLRISERAVEIRLERARDHVALSLGARG